MKSLYFENSIARVMALKIASSVSKNAAFAGFAPVQYADIPEPELPNSRWLKVKNIGCGLCGTDIHFLFMDMNPKCFPAALPGIKRKHLGHELVGEVIELGDDVDGLSVGDRVTVRVDWPSCFQMELDPPCRQCRTGNYMLCENLGSKPPLIIDNGGGFAPKMVLHRSQPFKIPDSLSNEQALLVEPVACAMHTVMKRQPEPGDKVLVIGGGTIGLLTLAVAATVAPEATVTCLTRYPFQAEAARKLGASEVVMDTGKVYQDIASVAGGNYFKGFFGNEILLGGCDVVYDTVGNDRTVNNALRWARGGGAVVLSGINFKPSKLDYSVIWNQEINFTGINCHATESTGNTSFEMAAAFIAETGLPLTDLITHRFPMENYREAIQSFLSKKDTHAIKIILEH